MIDSNLKYLFDQMPGAWGCKNENSVFQYANKEYAKLVGLKYHKDIIGRTDYDMPCETINCADLFRNQDKKVIQTLNKMRILDIHPFAGGEWRVYIFTKTPLFDNNQICLGTIFHGMDITNVITLEIGALLSKISIEGTSNDLLGQSSYILTTKFNKINLTNRQAEVLFYILRGKTAKQIGLFLSLSHRTIEEYLIQLKNIFNANSRSELIDKALDAGFLNTIPERLFRKQLSIELN